MRRKRRIAIELSVHILRLTMTAWRHVDDLDAPARLALRRLWAHCPEHWPLVQFWEGRRGGHDFGRSQSMMASFDGIIRQLRRSGAWRDILADWRANLPTSLSEASNGYLEGNARSGLARVTGNPSVSLVLSIWTPLLYFWWCWLCSLA